MAKQRLESPRRKMKPVFLVFCEGETEETYLDHLKQAYRSPIKIIPKVEGGDISQRLIDARSGSFLQKYLYKLQSCLI